MQYHIKKQIEEVFKITCATYCQYICASSSDKLGEKIKAKIETSNVKNYAFLTNSCKRISGNSGSNCLEELGENITNIKVGHMEILTGNYPDQRTKSFAFGILDPTKECIKMICNVGENKNIELSTYNDFSSLHDAIVNIIGKTPKCNWHYMILRDNENSCGVIEGTRAKRIQSENNFFSNFAKCCESITAVSFRQFSNDIDAEKKEELKHYVLFMV